jgi:multiple sugar transport system ATP-binding protein
VAGIKLSHVTKSFPGFVAINDVDLEINDGEFLVLVGPSGCGKTTLLRMIAGLEAVTAGAIWIGERNVTALAPKLRDVAMVFQDYALYPHMSVAENLGIGLKLRRVPKGESMRRVADAANLLSLEGLLKRKPSELSGGQRQRVAIGRAIVREPLVYLMDEPLSNLDAKLRVQMRAELARLRDRLRVTTVYVTHDQVEAMTLGDRVAVLKDGVLQQVATAQELFDRPATTFVAGFIGSPEMNLAHAEVVAGEVRFGGYSLAVPDHVQLDGRAEVIVGIRPTDFSRAPAGHESSLDVIRVKVDVTELLGAEMRVIFTVAARSGADVRVPAARYGAVAEELPMLRMAAEVGGSLTSFTASIDPDPTLSSGAMIDLAVNRRALHFFDPTTGLAIARANSAPQVLQASSGGSS